MIPRGRVLLEEELDLIAPMEWRGEMDELLKKGLAWTQPGVDIIKKRSNRCGGNKLTFIECGTCKKACAYCTACLQMGRSKRCSTLYYILDDDMIQVTTVTPILAWKGQLSPAQLEASNAAKEMVRSTKQKLLVWAVCIAHNEYISSQV